MPGDSQARKIFVSYKYKDANVFPLDGYIPNEDTNFLHTPRHYVDKLIDVIGEDHIYKGELSNEDASHLTDETIDSRLKEKIFDSSVTIVLLSPNMWDRTVMEKDQWIPNELAYSLRYKTRGRVTRNPNGVLAVALPDRSGSYEYAVRDKGCVREWQTESFFKILNSNMFNKKDKNEYVCINCFGSHHKGDDHSYIHPVKWSDFISGYNSYIEHAVVLRDRVNEFDIVKQHF